MNKTATILVLIFALIALGIAVFYMSENPTMEPDQNNQTEEPIDTNGETNEGDTTGASSVNVYVVDLEAGDVGCGDAIVPITREIAPTQGVLAAALEALLGLPDNDFGADAEYYNALENANLTVGSVDVENGIATVNLTGELSLGGACDTPRAIEQLKQTALQFETVSEANILLNGTPIEEALSERG